MRFLYLLTLVSLIGCGNIKKRAAINNSVFENNLSAKKSVFTPFAFEKILISSKVNFQYNQQFLTFDLTSRIDSGSKILISGNLILPIFKILIDNSMDAIIPVKIAKLMSKIFNIFITVKIWN